MEEKRQNALEMGKEKKEALKEEAQEEGRGALGRGLALPSFLLFPAYFLQAYAGIARAHFSFPLLFCSFIRLARARFPAFPFRLALAFLFFIRAQPAP